jgi:membrane-associated protein
MALSTLIQIFLHLDKSLAIVVQNYGFLVYPLVFLIIFFETGFVITPFFPGDSLLFAAGAIAAVGSMNILILFFLISLAAVLGDTINYWIGRYVGVKTLRYGFQRKYFDSAQKFYSRHGGKTIIIARFVPFIRTFAPFVAGIGKMNYPRFFIFNVIGGLLWVTLFLFAGYYFGNIPLVKENFSFVILGIILVSLLPLILNLIKERNKK